MKPLVALQPSCISRKFLFFAQVVRIGAFEKWKQVSGKRTQYDAGLCSMRTATPIPVSLALPRSCIRAVHRPAIYFGTNSSPIRRRPGAFPGRSSFLLLVSSQ